MNYEKTIPAWNPLNLKNILLYTQNCLMSASVAFPLLTLKILSFEL